MPESGQLTLSSAEETEALGDRLARAVRASGVGGFAIYLEGDLGTGKTTLARGFLRGLGHPGRVASPTYTLMEPYELPGCSVCHMDLYRIRSPSELLDLGLQDVLAGGSILLVEWPDGGNDPFEGHRVRVTLSAAYRPVLTFLVGGEFQLQAVSVMPISH